MYNLYKLKAKLLEISSDTHQLHYIQKHHFIIIIITVDTVLRLYLYL